MPTVAVVLPAAGRSSRFGGERKKVFADLAGRAVWRRSVEAFAGRTDVAQLLVVAAAEEIDAFAGVEVVAGGAECADSVGNALAHLRDDIDFVAVHDAARPCVTAAQIDAVFAAAVKTGAALLAVPVSDTVKRADAAGNVETTLSRAGLWLAQTPQVFRRDWLVAAHRRRGEFGSEATDDAQLVEWSGHAVALVPGSTANLKITTARRSGVGRGNFTRRERPIIPRQETTREGKSYYHVAPAIAISAPSCAGSGRGNSRA